MKILRTLFILMLLFSYGCADQSKQEPSNEDLLPIEGVWKRLGTLRVVNGIPVDTLLIADSDDKLFSQAKILAFGHSMWVNNTGDTVNSPWKGGMGGFGKYEMKDDILTEKMQSGAGWFGGSLDYYKDSLGVEYRAFDLLVDVDENIYSQSTVDSNGVANDFHELWKKQPDAADKTKLDGLWKRVFEISYINGIAVDTVSVPDDAILDVKVMKNGHFIYTVDRTGLHQPDEPMYGGSGAYGKFKYSNGNLVEYTEFTAGNFYVSPKVQEPYSSTLAAYHSVEFYSDDMFLQIAKDTLNQLQIGRGLVYEKIKN